TAPTIATRGARIEASGAGGGGVVRLGGGRQGAGRLAHAERVTVDAGTVIRADARVRGNGGDVVVWSDVRTQFSGTITARGGREGGNGGEAEVSSKGVLAYDGTTLLTAAKGRFGTLLLDPYDITISDGAQTTGSGFTATGNDSVIKAATLQTALATANVTVSTGAAGGPGGQAGTITVAAPLSWSTGTRLTLEAASAIAVNAPITVAGGGQLTLTTGTEPVGSSTQPLLSFGQGASVTFASGQSGQALTINSQGYTLVRTMADLDGIDGVAAVAGGALNDQSAAGGLAGRYALAGNLDASGRTYTDALVGTGSSGTDATQFTGTFEGLGHTLTGLTIDKRGNSTGLFGLVASGGTVRNVGLVGGSFRGSYWVGSLVGYNYGTAIRSYATGAVSGGSISLNTGGLVGTNDGGTVSQSYATGPVSGASNVGGLVGYNTESGTVIQSYATGTVRGINSNSQALGGLIGGNRLSRVSESYAIGAVSGGSGSSAVGGLVGSNSGSIADSYYNTDTAGQPRGVGSGSNDGVTGLTTANLTARLPDGFSTDAWANVGNRTSPYLTANPGPVLVGADGTARLYNLVFTLPQLQAINANLAGNYALANDIDAAGTTYTTGVIAGGSTSAARPTPFSGRLDGLGHAVRNLTISGGGNRYVGLIGHSTGTVRDIGVVGGSVSGQESVGGLVGLNGAGGTVVQAYATGTVTGSIDLGVLVGRNGGTVNQSYATGAVTGPRYNMGGLVGTNDRGSTISQSFATGSSGDSGSSYSGGLVGSNSGLIIQSYSTGSSGGSGSSTAGGLVGINDSNGTVVQSYATGVVAAGSSSYSAGALVGSNSGSVTASYYNTDTAGQPRGVGSGQSGGVTGLTTANLTAGLPGDFTTGVWANVGNRTSPYLTANPGPVLVGADGTARLYNLIFTLPQLQAINANLAGNYALANDIDAAGTSFTTGVIAGGGTSTTAPTPFSGRLDGLGHAVRDLTITGGSNNYVGLIGHSTGTVRDIGVVGGSISGASRVGGLVGNNDGGTVSQSYATGAVTGGTDSTYVGGLVGRSLIGGTVSQSYATGPVSGSNDVGGLVGNNYGSVSRSSATGAVSGVSSVGGLVGFNASSGTVGQSFATGAVTGSAGTSFEVGGLVGDNGGTVSGSSATGATRGQRQVGGLVGYNRSTGTVIRSYAVGAVSGLGNSVGGLVGRNDGGAVSGSYATGSVAGSNNVGGLLGFNDGGTVSQSYATGAVSGSQGVGGLVGFNDFTSSRIDQSYATGAVSGSEGVGGLVGVNYGTVEQSHATGAIGGSSRYVGGLVGYSNSTINQSYATGAVTGDTGSSFVGGLVGENVGTVTASAWDTQTSGQTTSAGGTGYTTRQLQGLDPVSGSFSANNLRFFSTASALGDGTTSAFSGGASGLYPYLTHFFPTGVQAVSGTAYADRGLTPLASGVTPAHVTLAVGGTLTRVTTGANGAYYVALPAGTLASGGTATLAYTTGDGTPAGTVTGASLIGATGTTRGLDIWGNTLIAPTTATSLLGAPGTVGDLLTPANRTLLTAARGGTGLGDPAGLTGVGYIATGAAGFTLDAPVAPGAAGGLYVRSTQGPVRVAQEQVLSGAGLTLLSAGSLAVNAPVRVQGAGRVALGYDAADPGNLSFAQGAGLTFLNADGSAATAAVAGQALAINSQGYTLVRTMADLDGIDGVAAVAGGAVTDQSAAGGLAGRYALAGNLDGSGTTYADALVGTGATRFSGTFEGLGHTLTGLTIDKAGEFAGLFGAVGSGGTVRNLGLVGGSVRGSSYVGGLVGYNVGTVSRSYAVGAVTSFDRSSLSLGGLVGANSGTVSRSYAAGAVTGTSTGTVNSMGGLVGLNGTGGTVSQSYSTSAVTGSTTGSSVSVGGLVGQNYGGSVIQSYATGAVSGSSSVGGLVGFNDGGGTVTDSAWNTQTTGLTTSAGGLGLTTADLQNGSLPAGFNSAVWATGPGLYPYLNSFFPAGVQAVTATVQPAGVTAPAGIQVGFHAGGSLLGGGTVSAGANGYVYQAVAAGTLPAGPVRIGASLAPAGGGAPTGLLYTDAAQVAGSVLALDPIITGLNRQTTAQTTYSGLQADLAATFGAGPLATLTTALAATPLAVSATGAGFTLDRALSAGGSVGLATTARGATLTLAADLTLGAGSLTLAAAGRLDQTAGRITAGRLTGSSGADLRLAGAGNAIGTLDGLRAGGALAVATTTDLTLAAGSQVFANGDVALATPGAFLNTPVANAVVSTGGRWLIYAAAPAGNAFGGLDSGNTAVWGTAPGAAVTAAGNRYVFAATPTLTVTTTDLAKTYGEDAAARVAGAYTLAGLDPGRSGAYRADTATGAPAVTSAGAGARATVAGGPYAITADAGSLTAPAGYRVVFADAGRLTVTPAALTITAADRTKVYGDAPDLGTTGFTTAGLVNGDTVGAVALASAGTATTATVAGGPYAITAAAAQGTGLANYRITYADAPTGLTVTPRPVTLSGTRVYDAGTAIAGGLLTAGNLVGADTVTVAGTGLLAAKDVGAQALADPSGLTLSNPNYTLAGATGAVTITPATLTYAADPVRRTYGAANPPLTGTVTGLLGADTLAEATTGTAAFTTGAGPGSNVGSYAVTGSGLAARNYVFAQAAGNATALGIDPALLTVTGTKTYDATAGFGAGQLTVTGGVDGESVALTAGSATAASAEAGLHASTSLTGLAVAVTGGNGLASNYALPAGAALTITPRPVTVTANSGASVYGDAPVDPGLSATGLAPGEGIGVLTGLSSGFALDAASAAGAYPLAVA
ncbi:GLUG motif-containing protein, partial [Methylobacterium oryzihabitans]